MPYTIAVSLEMSDEPDILLEKIILNEGISINVNNKNHVIEGKVLKLHRLRYANDVLMKDETK